MEITIVNRAQNPEKNTPSYHREILQKGLEGIGVKVSRCDVMDSPQTKLVACWGWKPRISQRLRKLGHDVLVMERAYIGDRFAYTSLGWNGLNNYAEFPQYPDDGGKRFKEIGGVLKPWKKGGGYILILGQVKGDASLQSKDIASWYARMAKSSYSIHKLPVFFRPHPDSVKTGRGYINIRGFDNIVGNLQDALEGAFFTVAYNSNSCLDSILNGIPCIAGDGGTMAWDLCSRSLRDIDYPERGAIVNRISHTQWSEGEISQGDCLKKLMDMKG